MNFEEQEFLKDLDKNTRLVFEEDLIITLSDGGKLLLTVPGRHSTGLLGELYKEKYDHH